MSEMLSAPSPFSLLLFGASGHLARFKIYPALYTLTLKKRLPKDYAVVGFSRTAMNDASFRTCVAESVRTDMMGAANESVLKEFLTHCWYHTGEYTEEGDYHALRHRLTSVEKGWRKGVRLAYYSVPPTIFSPISENLCKSGFAHDRKELRCILEKPVGHNFDDFRAISSSLKHCVHEKHIYFLDHYLGKEAARNVYYLRLANPILEEIFAHTLLQYVEISAPESAGIEGRAGYFDHTGTLRDIFQSHLLMVASLLTMRLTETPVSFARSRLEALRRFYVPPARSLKDVIIQGQYAAGTIGKEQVKGYRNEEGVPPHSRTNTFVALRLRSRMPRWEGIPFLFRAGKRLAGKETRLTLSFQEPWSVGKGAGPNRLDIILQGEAGMRFHLQTKLGGTEPAFRPLILSDPLVCEGDCLPEHGLLLLEAIHGKKQWFLSPEEVDAAWRLIDPLQAYLDDPATALHSYRAGTDGPKAAEEWIAREGIKWL
ncbi:MAG: glucose-6-phosphate dehydrogenase [Candidatus Peregrinibacteria bacterium]